VARLLADFSRLVGGTNFGTRWRRLIGPFLQTARFENCFLVIDMAHISLNKVVLDFPIFNVQSRSFKKTLADSVIGGRLLNRRSAMTVRALEDVSFELQEGDRLGVIGGNGSGKTSLLRLMSGVYSPTSGVISRSGRIGSMLAINSGMDLEESAKENVYLRGLLMGISKRNMKNKIDEILDFADLGDFANLPVRTYSSGMMMRLAFSIATAGEPELLFMDEWLSAGDEQFRVRAQSRLKKLVDSTKILVLASHSRPLIEANCNKVIWLAQGRIVATGEPKDVLNLYFGNLAAKITIQK
jgi:lipopolysaccharide transport system ATP-binding protein